MTKFIKSCNEFRNLLKSECVMMPGAFNGLVARSCAENGKHPKYIFLEDLYAKYLYEKQINFFC